jgi:hypothetical protein
MSSPSLRYWLLAPLTVAGAFFAFGIAAALAADVAGLWELPVAGFVAAFAVVVSAYVAAPSHKLSFACVCFLVGAALAWWMLKDSYWPERHSLAYQPTLTPLWWTYLGGCIGLDSLTG